MINNETRALLELSTQVLIDAADRRKVRVEVLDVKGNFLRLSRQQGTVTHVEYVSRATETSKDSIAVYKLMENKHISKWVLREAGLRVPEGGHFSNSEAALSSYVEFSKSFSVVKPNNTNMGVGISFLKAGCGQDEYVDAVNQAFSYGSSVLVEEFIPGEEYRFLVIDFKVVGICKRIPANVVGDGKLSISELVEQKNQDPRRGVDHRRPLEVINLSEVELAELKLQGLTVHSVIPKDEMVFLRRNSNISTGGDSIDVTDEVHADYLQIAEEAAKAVDAKITGIDIIISDPSHAPTSTNHAIIEVNFNPVLYIHVYPWKGTSRPVGEAILDLLGFH